MKRQVLFVHGADDAWTDLVDALAPEAEVDAVGTLQEAEHRICSSRPDVFVLDGRFERGVDLLLQARHTACGHLIIIVRRLPGPSCLYAATLPGDVPRYLSPLTVEELAREIKSAIPAWTGIPAPQR